ncbi:MAG: hypothetical protein U0270_14765 [Labilithrix sp.]
MKLALGTALLAALGIAACTTAPASEVSASSEDQLRALQPNEILGEINYGDTREVDLTPTPDYRAFYFYGDKYDQIQLTATAIDATDPIMWFLDADFNLISRNADARPTDTSSLISGQYLPKTGKYYVVFRETYRAPQAKFAVSLRKLGTLPEECDPNGEGTFDSACTDPLGYDPFDPASCEGDDLTAEAAKSLFGGTNGFRPAKASVFYNTRQCVAKPGAEPDCSPWVYAFIMDVRFTTIKAKAAPAGSPEGTPAPLDTYTLTDTTVGTAQRKSTIEFTTTPAALTSACLDGPFAAGPLSAEMSSDWTQFADGSAGVCATTALTGKRSKVTSTCMRFELPSITLGSGESTHYTELSPVLHAKF